MNDELIVLAEQVMNTMEGFGGNDECPTLDYLKKNFPDGEYLKDAVQECIDYLYDSDCEDADYYQTTLDNIK